MIDQSPTFESAENLRRNQQYKEAEEQFAILWEHGSAPSVGWRYANCLRKQGRLEEAEKVVHSALTKYPEDKYAKSELGWVLYDKELKPAKKECDLGRVIHFANEILLLNSDSLAISRVVLAVMKVAKERNKWEVVLEWSAKLNPDELSAEARTFDGRRGMSDKETWYVGRARALLEVERYAEARDFAQVGLQEFPNELFLARTAALAYSKMDHLDESAAELHALISHPRADWYVKADLAELEYVRGNHAEAYRLLCDALSNSQDDEYKLGCFVTLGYIALALGHVDIAAEHVALAKSLRTAKNWSIPSELAQLEKATQAALATAGEAWPDLPSDSRALSKICHQRWQTGKVEGLEFIRGTLGPLNPDKPFAFIKRDDGSESVFVIVRDIPRKCAREGARLEFTLKKSFDRKKNRESVQAANVRCFSE